jgi:hypothetical protein
MGATTCAFECARGRFCMGAGALLYGRGGASAWARGRFCMRAGALLWHLGRSQVISRDLRPDSPGSNGQLRKSESLRFARFLPLRGSTLPLPLPLPSRPDGTPETLRNPTMAKPTQKALERTLASCPETTSAGTQ